MTNKVIIQKIILIKEFERVITQPNFKIHQLWPWISFQMTEIDKIQSDRVILAQ